MIARPSPITDAYWNCYAYSANGSHVVEGRLLFSFQLTKERMGPDGAFQKAEVFGNFGSFVTGAFPWQPLSDNKLTIGSAELVINDCTKDFLKLSSTTERTTYYFIAQKSRSYSSF